MTTAEFLPAVHHDSAECLSPVQKQALQRAVAKIVTLGAQAGVSVDQMIQLLQSGLTIGELLDYIASQSVAVA